MLLRAEKITIIRFNPETGESAYKEVQQVFVSKTDVLVHIEVNGEDIKATMTHPFLVDGRWIAAKDLRAGDLLTLADGTKVSIEKVRYEKLTAPVLVYNFEVADFHTYYVGNSQVLVHNTCNKTGNTEEVGLGGNQSVVQGESGVATKIEYKKVFFEQNPDLKGQVVVHHGIEQQVLTRAETKGLFTPEEIHAYDNLRGIPNEVNSDVHLSKIRKEWNQFYKENLNPTKDQLLVKRLEIDQKYGNQFYPPI